MQVGKFLLPLHPSGSLLHQLAERQQRSEMLGRAYTKVGCDSKVDYTKVVYTKVGHTKVGCDSHQRKAAHQMF